PCCTARDSTRRDSSAAEGLENPFVRRWRRAIFRGLRMLVVRRLDDFEQTIEGAEVAVLRSCVQCGFDTMIARNERRVGVAHAGEAFALGLRIAREPG